MGFQDFFGRKPKSHGPSATTDASVLSTPWSSAWSFRNLLGPSETVPVSSVEYKSTTDASLAATNMEASMMEMPLEEQEKSNEEEKQLAIQLLDYFCLFEESKYQKKTFCSEYESDKDWTDNHFLRDKKTSKSVGSSRKSQVDSGDDGRKEEENCKEAEKKYDSVVGIQLTSYEAHLILQKQKIVEEAEHGSLLLPLKINDGDIWIRFSRKEPDSLLQDLTKIDPTFLGFYTQVKEQKWKAGPLQNVGEFKQVLYRISDKDVKQAAENGCKNIGNHASESMKYFLCSELKGRQKVLFDIKYNKKFQNAEVLVGFCQVRGRIAKSKGISIVNGPLFEVEMAVQDCNETESIFVKPKAAAKIRLNTEVLNSLGLNSVTCTRLSKLAANMNVSSIKLGETSTYADLLKESKILHHTIRLSSTSDECAHCIPEDPDCIHLVGDAWCLYTRQPTTTSASRDCRALADALRDGKRDLTLPARAILNQPTWLHTLVKRENSHLATETLLYPLKSTEDQKLIGQNFLCSDAPVFTVHGPPGSGKTQTAVNIASAYLTMNTNGKGAQQNVVITSTNQQALMAQMDLVPLELQPFFVRLPLENQESGLRDLHRSLETLIERCRDAMANREKHAARAKNLSEYANKKLDMIEKIDERLRTSRKNQQKLVENPDTLDLVKVAIQHSNNPGLVRAVLASKKTALDALLGQSEVSFAVFDAAKIEEYSRFARAKTNPKIGGFVYIPVEILSFVEGIKVGSSPPNSKSDWKLVATELESRQKGTTEHSLDGAYFSKYGCENITNNDGSLKSCFIRDLKTAMLSLRSRFDLLPQDIQGNILEFMSTSSNVTQDQELRCKLRGEIQQLDLEIVIEQFLAGLGQVMTPNKLGVIIDFCQVVGEANDTAMDSSKETLKVNEVIASIRAKFHATAQFMPLLVMTHDQLSDMVSTTDTIGLIIVDEASQSEFTAARFLFRCNRMIVVGDDKQAAPKVVKTERLREISALAPCGIFSSSQLKIGSSLFDLFKVAFPISNVYMGMFEHFRCRPDIADTFNCLSYDMRLQPMRSHSQEEALVDLHVDIGGKRKKGDAIAFKLLLDKVKETMGSLVERGHCEKSILTLGIITFGNVKEVRQEVATFKEVLVERFGAKTVAAHRITIGSPEDVQGDERDVVILLDMEVGKYQQDVESKRNWTIALSRAKEKTYFVHSYKKTDLKGRDIRREVLDFFTEPSSMRGALQFHRGPVHPFSASVKGLWQEVQALLQTELIKKGFLVADNAGSKRWSQALCITIKNVTGDALICIENAGESDESWETTLKHQHSLEGANRSCLRIPLLSLALDFQTTFGWVLCFLRNAGLDVACLQNSAILDGDGKIQRNESIERPLTENPHKGARTAALATSSAKRGSLSRTDNDTSSGIAKRLKSVEQQLIKDALVDEDDQKRRGRVYFDKLYYKSHTKDAKLELTVRGLEVVKGMTFTEMKERLQEDEGNKEYFIPRSTAKFSLNA